jgi:uncharacterized membrane protein
MAIGWKSEFSLADLPVRGVQAYCALYRSSACLGSTPCFAPSRSCCNTSVLSFLILIKFVLWPFNIHVARHFIQRSLISSRLMLYECTFIFGICTLVTRCEFCNYMLCAVVVWYVAGVVWGNAVACSEWCRSCTQTSTFYKDMIRL